jgi:hypothetical protein
LRVRCPLWVKNRRDGEEPECLLCAISGHSPITRSIRSRIVEPPRAREQAGFPLVFVETTDRGKSPPPSAAITPPRR